MCICDRQRVEVFPSWACPPPKKKIEVEIMALNTKSLSVVESHCLILIISLRVPSDDVVSIARR